MAYIAPASQPAAHGVRAALAAVGHFFGGAFRAVQIARMTQVLHAMNDAQLAQIGLMRADIPSHARKMMDLSE